MSKNVFNFMVILLLSSMIKTVANVSRETSNQKDFLSVLSQDPDVINFFTMLGSRNSLVINVDNLAFLQFIVQLAKQKGYFPVVIFEKEVLAEQFYGDLLMSEEKKNSISWIPLFGNDAPGFNRQSLENHLTTFLSNIYSRKSSMLITGCNFFPYEVRNKDEFNNRVISISEGTEESFSSFQNKLIEAGYERTSAVEFVGEFCVRGGIIDVYAFGNTYPFRIEFFGDTIDSIRQFNPYDQQSFKEEDLVHIRPVSNVGTDKIPAGKLLPDNALCFCYGDDIWEDMQELTQHKKVLLSSVSPDADLHFSLLPIVAPKGSVDDSFYSNLIFEYPRLWVFAQYDILLENLYKHLSGSGNYVRNDIPEGFYLKSSGLAVLSGRQIFKKEHAYNPNKQFIPEKTESVSTGDQLKYGDSVVHVDHGLGVYRGIEIVEHRGIKQECLVLEYDGNDKVLVPVRHVNKIYRYSTEKQDKVKLDKIGSTRWESNKTKTRSYLKKAAFDLLSLYQDRKRLPGYAFDKDSPDTLELEASFPFDETKDQLGAINETKKDMENPTIMDRLICGDVGFGKTEVAIRAAFKAVYSGKQVGILTPTTILCYQHYESFKERLEPFGIRLEYLNRFKSAAESTRILRDLKEGQIDILIGTHRLLSPKCEFMDLGLLIVDEEHRFGVNHKETIQNYKRHVDVITLTATPIPRTLQLSLVGLKDITKIETAPKERLPISTKIMYWNENQMQMALQREFSRNGQVYILHNRINELPGLCDKIQDMFPDKDVRYAHGQMSGRELESTLLDFYHHEYDVLICTTIIESGIDIPNANTLIVMDSHRFGLSQLYQIRGRVGRSYKKAYAYLVVPRGHQLSPVALKRLQTLEYYTDLGSGYQIAMRDLEIRGFGNLLGVEQSGHVNRVGFDYFNKLFSEEVSKLKQTSDSNDVQMIQTDIHLDNEAYIPSDYIDNKNIRINFYREISNILDENSTYKSGKRKILMLEDQCRDRFGPLPRQALNLFRDSYLALFFRQYGIETVSRKGYLLFLGFSKQLNNTQIQQKAKELVIVASNFNRNIRFISKSQLIAECDAGMIKDIVPDKYLT